MKNVYMYYDRVNIPEDLSQSELDEIIRKEKERMEKSGWEHDFED